MMSLEPSEHLSANCSEPIEPDALDEALAGSIVSTDIPEEYRWDADDPSVGPFGRIGR